mgnify:CR=1 FL=1
MNFVDAPLIVAVAEDGLGKQHLEKLSQRYEQPFQADRMFFFVYRKKQEGVYGALVLDHSFEVWRYRERNLEVSVDGQTVTAVTGEKLFLGTKLWAQSGDTPRKLRSLGKALVATEAEFYTSDSIPTHTKLWNSQSIELFVKEDRIESFRLANSHWSENL